MFKDKKDRREYDRKYYVGMSKEQKQRKLQLQNERRIKVKNYVYAYKLYKSCLICGESEPACLDFHHISNDKEINIADAIRCGWSLDKIKKEIEKCVIVCANCHRLIHAGIISIDTQTKLTAN